MKKAPEVTTAPLGLRQKIRHAESLGELALLLQEGRRFEFASLRTQASWQRAAERRRKELGAV